MVAAAQRKTPTVANGGARDGTDYLNSVDAEIENLWKGAAFGWLTSIGGTGNAITAASDSAVVAAIAAYARPMAFWYQPGSGAGGSSGTGSNTAAVTINIDGVGTVNVKDQFGNALQGGEFVGGSTPGVYPLVWDGTQFRAILVTAGAANRPTTAPNIIAQEQQASGTNGHAGASFTAGTYRTRFLTTLVVNTIGASLASNQITLPAGTYYARWSCPAIAVQYHKTRLYNATDSSVIAYGTAEFSTPAASYAATRSVGTASFTLTSSKAIEVDHRCSSTENTNGFGAACGFGDIEIYTVLELWKQ